MLLYCLAHKKNDLQANVGSQKTGWIVLKFTSDKLLYLYLFVLWFTKQKINIKDKNIINKVFGSKSNLVVS